MENILELLCDMPCGKTYEQGSQFVRTARIKGEVMEMLNATITDEQKKLLEAYFDADAKIESMMQFDRFRYAFHLGAQLMEEIIKGKEEI